MAKGPRRPRPLRRRRLLTLTDPLRRTLANRRSTPRPVLRRKRILNALQLAGSAVGILLVLELAWVGFRAYQVREHLEGVRSAVLAARTDAASGDVDGAVTEAGDARRAAAALPNLTSDPLWEIGADAPIVGGSLRGVQGLGDAARTLSDQVVPPLIHAIDDLRGQGLRTPAGGIDLTRLTQAGANLSMVTKALETTRTHVAALPDHTIIGAVAGGRDQVLTLLDKVDTQLQGARIAAALAPGMLGADGPRHYFFALMNTAEARGSGGIIGAYALVTADQGRITLDRVGSDDDLKPYATESGPLPPDLVQRWGSFGVSADWRNADLSPNFPYTAAALGALYYRAFHTPLDGVVALDPTAAGYVVSATSPITLSDGTIIPGNQLTTYVEKTLYARFSDQVARKAALEQLQGQIFARLVTAESNPAGLLKALAEAASQGRLLVSSSRPGEEAQLSQTGIGGAVPSGPGPFAAVIVNNSSGDKLDFYLSRSISWTAGPCGGSERSSTVTANLQNGAPSSGLPDYATGADTIDRTIPPYSLREYVSIYGTQGAKATSVTLDGQPVATIPATERNHPVINLYVTLPPGARHTIQVVWQEPSAGPVHPLLAQALVTPPVITSSVAECS